jgi:hypothetical protein
MVHFVCEKQQSQTLLTHAIKPNFDSRANDKRQQRFFSCKSTTILNIHSSESFWKYRSEMKLFTIAKQMKFFLYLIGNVRATRGVKNFRKHFFIARNRCLIDFNYVDSNRKLKIYC